MRIVSNEKCHALPITVQNAAVVHITLCYSIPCISEDKYRKLDSIYSHGSFTENDLVEYGCINRITKGV